ncbi:MAG: substrate-binding domain-containing protein [Chloroflexota bacterium]|nr:substrate-binding domain-containing protein [Chloroflexota bacterium]MDE2896606.1 substrate-binding domain-containing protein [Chloroflexota bacterium]
MRNLIWVALGFILGAATLGAVWANVANTPDDPDGAVDVRILVERHASGDVEVGLQQREVSGEWGETLRPEHRFLLAGAPAGRPLHSSIVIVDTDSRYETIANAYADYLFASGQESALRFHERLGGTEDLPKMLCVNDLNDPGFSNYCEGIESVYGGEVERIEVGDYEDFRVELEAILLADRELGALFATSVPAANVVDEAREATRRFIPWSYWIELIDPHLPSPDNLHCVISHGSDEDLFWGLAAESSVAAAGMLGINVRNEVYTTGAEQADAVRRCVADGAVAIATTLADPEAMKPAVRQAISAGIPVISYNSGAEDAAEVGTALHISLDDHEAGRVAGEEFNRRGVEGNVLCVIHEPENQGLHDRCDGLAESFNGTVERWSMTDRATTVEELHARLDEGDVGAVLGLSSSIGSQVRAAIFDSRLNVRGATFGFSRTVAEYVSDGRLMFAIFDHPEIQSYLAAVGALLAERLRIDPMAYFNSAQMLITPTIVNAEEMQALLDSLTDWQE